MRSTLSRIASAAAVVAAAAPAEAGQALATTLFGALGFRGNTDDYYDPRNSFLSEVLARKVGIPISLSVLYLEVARRLGIPAAGVAFPGHFLVRVDQAREPLILDPFGGGAALDRSALETLLARAVGTGRPPRRRLARAHAQARDPDPHAQQSGRHLRPHRRTRCARSRCSNASRSSTHPTSGSPPRSNASAGWWPR